MKPTREHFRFGPVLRPPTNPNPVCAHHQPGAVPPVFAMNENRPLQADRPCGSHRRPAHAPDVLKNCLPVQRCPPHLLRQGDWLVVNLHPQRPGIVVTPFGLRIELQILSHPEAVQVAPPLLIRLPAPINPRFNDGKVGNPMRTRRGNAPAKTKENRKKPPPKTYTQRTLMRKPP